MLKVALTGGIATGKSHVLAQLRARGIPTIDADDIVHTAFRPGATLTQSVASEFGHSILKPDGSVDRSVLAATVFADTQARLRLEAIVHPTVYKEIERWFGTIDGPIGIASIPLLYETRRESDFDAVLVTACSNDQQLQRLLERGLSEEEAQRRISAQLSTEEKVRRADFVIWTSGTPEETAAQVDEILTRLSDA